MTLPPFSGDDPTCAKCGLVGAYTHYLGWFGRGRLLRKCIRCGYEWDEATV